MRITHTLFCNTLINIATQIVSNAEEICEKNCRFSAAAKPTSPSGMKSSY
jgi:hypothetical protein